MKLVKKKHTVLKTLPANALVCSRLQVDCMEDATLPANTYNVITGVVKPKSVSLPLNPTYFKSATCTLQVNILHFLFALHLFQLS